jgi:diguanylate cyclase (GGDEF)-like protein/PAS domain S-box-containing protein
MQLPTTVRSWQAWPASLQVLLFALLVYLFGSLAIMVRPSVGGAALWWPGAGIAVLGLLLVERRQRPALLLAVTAASVLSSLVGGRGASIAVLFALINALEAVLVHAILARRRPDPRALEDLHDLRRLLAAVLIGAATAGLAVGVVATSLLDATFLTTAASATASHAGAVLMLVIVGLRAPTPRVEASDLEQGMQWVAVAVATVLVFSPRQALPLAFLLPVSILWGALRSSIRAASLQLLTVSILASVFTAQGRGPFATATDLTGRSTHLSIILVQMLVLSSAAVLLTVVVTVAQRRAALLDVTRSEELFRVGFTSSLLGLLLLRPEAEGLRIVELNGVAARLLGTSSDRLAGSLWGAPLAPADLDLVDEAVAAMAQGDSTGWHAELPIEVHGQVRWCEVAISPAVEAAAAGNLVTVQMVDVTSRREAEERLAQLALRDGLTGLANRVLLEDRLEQALADCRRMGLLIGIAFLDLDGFKLINDVHGHAVGDRFLVALGERLSAVVRRTDTVARIGGDEFVVVCPGLTGPEELDDVVARIREAVRAPVTVQGMAIHGDLSIGSTLGRGDSEPRELLRRADAAMYAQKRAGGGRTHEAPAATDAATPARAVSH